MSGATTTDVFSTIFRKNAWRGASKSGPGSTLHATGPIRSILPSAFAELGVSTLIDAPCGTAEWITLVTDQLAVYLGFDVVPDLVSEASVKNTRPNHFFMTADITTAILPKADAIFCRDCIVHLPLEIGMNAISNFVASRSRYLMATTFPSVRENTDIVIGSWRPLNLQAEPFNFPEPIMVLPDRLPVPNDPYADKSIGVWMINP